MKTWTDYIAELVGDQRHTLRLQRSPMLDELDLSALDASVRALPKGAASPLTIQAEDYGEAIVTVDWNPQMLNPLRLLLRRLDVIDGLSGIYDFTIDQSADAPTLQMVIVMAPNASGFLVTSVQGWATGFLPPQFVSLANPDDDETFAPSKWCAKDSKAGTESNEIEPTTEATPSSGDDVDRKVIELRAQDLSLGQIAMKVGIPRRRVQTILDAEKKKQD